MGVFLSKNSTVDSLELTVASVSPGTQPDSVILSYHVRSAPGSLGLSKLQSSLGCQRRGGATGEEFFIESSPF